jgi:serine/threonine protein kinase
MGTSSINNVSLIGRTLGNYVVKTLIGRGAMGTVYLATDQSLGRSVALKVLLGTLARSPGQLEKFQQEAKSAAPLQHPNIVRVYEAGVLEGVPYIAMEYVEGEPLDRFLRRSGPLTWQNALHIAHQVAQALECAHRADLVHCDVKPSNILLDRRGRVRLMDFGIAKVQHRKGRRPTPTEFLATPQYMSPEQCGAGGAVGLGTDLFSLGVMLYQMISGRMPFEGESTVALVTAITTEQPPRLNQIVMGVPDDVARLVAHLMEKDMRHRPHAAGAVCMTIERLHRENGGASAVPEALNAFVREQAEPRTLSTKAGSTTSGQPRKPFFKFRGTPKQYSSVSLMSQALAGAIFVVVFLGFLYWQFHGPKNIALAAPEIHDTRFDVQSAALRSVPLPGRDWHVSGMHWSGSNPVLIVGVAGAPGTTKQGAHGRLSVNLSNETILSLSSPAGPISDADAWRYLVPSLGGSSLPAVAETSPFHNAMLVHAYAGSPLSSSSSVVTLLQKTDEAVPRRDLLFRAPTGQWNPQIQNPWHDTPAGHAVMHPNGKTLCLLLFDEESHGNYLIERDTTQKNTERTGARCSPPGDPIIASSMLYSPDGTYLSYMRDKGAGERELWVIPSGGTEDSGRLITLGRLGNEFSFSPDSTRMVVGFHRGNATHLMIVRAEDGSIASQPGLGHITHASWHPSGRWIVVRAVDEAGETDQLWAVESISPHRRLQLTHLPQGVEAGGVVSRDGRWIAAVVSGATGPEIVLVSVPSSPFQT